MSRTNGYYVFTKFTHIYIELELAGEEREWPVVCDTLIRLHLKILVSSLFSPSAATTIDQSLTQLSEMASGGGVICLACAELKKGNRRILVASNSTEVTVPWKEVISRDTDAPILWSILYASIQTRRPAQNRKAVTKTEPLYITSHH